MEEKPGTGQEHRKPLCKFFQPPAVGVKSSWYPFPSLNFSNFIWPNCVNCGHPEWPVAGCSVLGSARCSQHLLLFLLHSPAAGSWDAPQLCQDAAVPSFPVSVPWAVSQISRRAPPQCPSPKLKSTGNFRIEITDAGAAPGLFLSSEQTQQWQEVLPCQEIAQAADGLTTPWVLPAPSGRDQQ